MWRVCRGNVQASNGDGDGDWEMLHGGWATAVRDGGPCVRAVFSIDTLILTWPAVKRSIGVVQIYGDFGQKNINVVVLGGSTPCAFLS